MIYQPWIGGPQWQKADPKLVEITHLPNRLPHTTQLVKQIDLEPAGILMVSGPRQVGKSTFLREFARKALASGIAPEAVALFNAEEYENRHALTGALETVVTAQTGYSVILIDEITSLEKWWLSLKVLADKGVLKQTLIVCTGSSAPDIQDGADFLPGRRGRRHPVDFELFPVRFRDIGGRLSLDEFMLTGGMPWAINEYLRLKIIPAYVYQLYASWIEGAFIKKMHAVTRLPHLLNYLMEHLSSPFSVQKLSRDCGIGSNSTAETYLALLERNYIILPCLWADIHTHIPAPRKNRKFYPINPFLVHVMYNYGKGWENVFSTAKDMCGISAMAGHMAEALVATELRQRNKDTLSYWQGKKEIDFTGKSIIEVKYQAHVSTTEFEWAQKTLPQNTKLTVLTRKDHAEDRRIRLVPLEQWLKE